MQMSHSATETRVKRKDPLQSSHFSPTFPPGAFSTFIFMLSPPLSLRSLSSLGQLVIGPRRAPVRTLCSSLTWIPSAPPVGLRASKCSLTCFAHDLTQRINSNAPQSDGCVGSPLSSLSIKRLLSMNRLQSEDIV